MLRLPLIPTPLKSRWVVPAVIVALVGTMSLALPQFTRAQVANVLTGQEPKKPEQPENKERSIEAWKADVEQRLVAVAEAIESAEKEDVEPPRTAARELNALTRLNLLLTQLVGEQAKAEKLDEEQQTLKKTREELIQDGLPEDADTSFRRLDKVREDLESEQRRLQRGKNKEESAQAALETAEEELKERSSARRRAQERADDNSDDKRRQALGEALADAIEQNEIAEAALQLRKQELANAKTSLAAQEFRVGILEETENRLSIVVSFGPTELAELFEDLDRQEDELQKRLATFESAAKPRIRYVEEQWISARREVDAATGKKNALQERVRAFELEYQSLRTLPSLLRQQIDRLAGDRKVWRLRQRVFQSRPDGQTVALWTEESDDAATQLRREERKELFEIDDLKEKLSAVRQRLQQAEDDSEQQQQLEKQVASLRKLQTYREENLNSIRNSLWLHERLLGELKGTTFAATAKDHLHSVWRGVKTVWNYELTAFGEKGAEKSVTVQKVVTALLVLFAGLILSRVLSRALGNQVLRRLDIDPSATATIQALFFYVLLLTFALFALNVAKVPLTAFTVLSGAVALGVGFGSQNIINNFISGLILLSERPVKVGDLIQLDQPNGDQLYGNIEHIGARSTVVRTGSNLEIIVPNSSFLQNNVVNFTRSNDKVRTKVEVGVIYGSPTVSVTRLLRRAVVETGRVAKDPPPIILFKNFADNSLVFEVHFWLRMRTMMDQMQIESAVRFRIDQLFREEDIVIAFPQRDVHLDASTPIPVQMVEQSDENHA